MKTKAFCSFPFHRLRVNSNGECGFCCFQDVKVIGNLFESNVEEVWFSETAKAIREETLKGRLHAKCNSDACPFFKNKSPFEFYHKQFPTLLELYLPNTHCNIGGTSPKPNTACMMCARANVDFVPDADRTNEICERLKSIKEHFSTIHVQGWAEPFWKDKIFEVVKLLNPDLQTTKITTVTNGTVWNKENRIERWLDLYPKSWVGVSLDAGTPETFKKIRKVDLYHKVIESINKFTNLRKEGQAIRIQNNINMFNINEVEEMVVVAAKTNVDSINFTPTFPEAQVKDSNVVCQENVDSFKKAEQIILETADKLNVQVGFARPMTLAYTL